MRAIYRLIVPIIVLGWAAYGQTLAPSFRFLDPIKPGDSLTVDGTDMATITTVALKAAGKPDLAATAVQATSTNVKFTVPLTASGIYTVALSSSKIDSIPLTVTPVQANGGSGVPDTTAAAVTQGTTGSVPTYTIYMPDGQLHSHPIRVYVTANIPPNPKPKLRLLRSRAVSEAVDEDDELKVPVIVAPGQQWMESFEGEQFPRSGTLLLFDLSELDFQYKAMLRVMPIVTWTDGDVERTVVGSSEVNIGNIVWTLIWTLLIVGVALAVILKLSWRSGGRPLLFLTGANGRLSLAQTQIALWTVAVGGVVLAYGLIKLDIPDIPDSLLVLMGASLATGGIGFFKDRHNHQAAVNAGATPPRPELGDLVRVFRPKDQCLEFSLAKAQMLFWTVLLLVLFLAKSSLDGEIWAVPWELVALMGFSQAGFLAPKLAPPTAPVEPPPTPPVEPPPKASG